MPRGLNNCQFIGNVGRDPEIKATQGGMVIATFSLAVADRKKDGSGNWVDSTEWINLIAFQRTAEIVRDYVHKGSRLFIAGKMQTRSWDDKDSGAKRYKTEIIVNDLIMLDTKKDSESHGGGGRSSSTSAQPDYADQGITDDDIPF